MAEPVAFTVLPAPRCCWITSRSPLVICNRPAHWMPAIAGVDVTPFWCGEHKQPGCTPIAGVTIVRRVAIVAQVLLTSSLEQTALAEAEVLARFDRGVQAVGGLVSLHTVSSRIGAWAAPLGLGGENGDGGAGKG